MKNRCLEEPDMPYEDGNTTLFLYAYGKKDIPSQKLADMLKYFVESSEENAKRADLDSIHQMMENIKSNSKLEEAYMQSWEVEGYFTELGIQQGIKQGEISTTNKIAITMMQDGKEFSEISKYTGLSVDKLKKLEAEIKKEAIS